MTPGESFFTAAVALFYAAITIGRCLEWFVATVEAPWLDHPSPFPIL